jgi:hypothetical protein
LQGYRRVGGLKKGLIKKIKKRVYRYIAIVGRINKFIIKGIYIIFRCLANIRSSVLFDQKKLVNGRKS